MEREMYAQYAYEYDGEWCAIARAIAENDAVFGHDIKEKYITIEDDDYPASLRSLRYPPWILFYEGDISLLKKPVVTIVGSRMISHYGKVMTELCAGELCSRFVLASGLAKGVDACVHRTGLSGMGTIGVIGSGLATHYPSCNEKLYRNMQESRGLILSEYPYHTGVQKYHFPWRNRILAALGEKIIVTQAALKSGTMLTVNEAINLSKDVYCVPYPYDVTEGKGCNRLIADGAMILYEQAQLDEIQPSCLHS